MSINFESISNKLKKYTRIACDATIGYIVGDAVYQRTGDERSSVICGVVSAFAFDELSSKTEHIVSAKVDQIRSAKEEEEDDEDDLDDDFFDQIAGDLEDDPEYSGDPNLEFPHGNYQDQMKEEKSEKK